MSYDVSTGFSHLPPSGWRRLRLTLAWFVFLTAVVGSWAQDLAPATLRDVIYIAYPTNPRDLEGNGFYPGHYGVLSGNGVRTPISTGISGMELVGGYGWNKTGANTGTLTLTSRTVNVRMEVTLATGTTGTYRQTIDASTAVVLGNLSFVPVPRDPTPVLLNLSTRVTLTIGQITTVGFQVTAGPSRRAVVRAIGPALAQFGVTNAAPDPTLVVLKGSEALGTNAGWGGAASTAEVFAKVGAFALPTTSKDAALVLTLAPGNYTAQVRAETGGEVLVEVYFVD